MDPDIQKQAEKRVRRIKKFYKNLASWLLVSAFLFGINIFTSGADHLWAIYPFLGWGLGVAIEAVSLFGVSRTADDWEERKTREIARRLERKNRRSEPAEEKPLDLEEAPKRPLYRDEDLV